MCGPGAAGGVVFGDDPIYSRGKVDEEIIFEVAGRAKEISVVFLGKVCDFVDKRKELWAKAAKRFDDTRDNIFALSSRVSHFLVLFSRDRRKTGC